MNLILKVVDLSFSYQENCVLDSISLDLEPGTRTALLGANGSGKTTLFHLICGLLSPSGGFIEVAGVRVKSGTFRQETGFLFQSPDDQLFSSTLFDDVVFGPLNLGLDQEAARKQGEKTLEKVGLLSLKDRSPHHLSGGEKRMGAIATVLAMNPELLLFDEPSSNLDARNRRRLISTINALPQAKLVSSHDLEFLLETCDKGIFLGNGKIKARGPLKVLLSDSRLLEAQGMEKPYSLR